MKWLRRLVLLVGLNAWPALAVETGVVEVQLVGDLKPGGQILVSFENKRAQYEAKGGKVAPYRQAVVEATDKKDIYVARFEGVPFGSYTVRAFYDQDRDGELATNLVGYPKEAYGISNNARGLFGLPSYRDAKFEVRQRHVIQKIKLK